MNVGYYETATGRSPPREFIGGLPATMRAAVRSDVHLVAEHGQKAPVSMKPVRGYLPMWEIRTGGFRTFYYFADRMLVVLHVCKKQDQKRGIVLAHKRMRELREG
jgi:phage-related protein